jgi:transposase
VKEFLKKEGEELGIKVVLLPPYSPELNPDEQVWNQAKREIGSQSLNTKKNLREAVERALQAIQTSVKMVQSFFLLRDTKYACAAN